MAFLEQSIKEKLKYYLDKYEIKIRYLKPHKLIKDIFMNFSREKPIKTLAEELKGVFQAVTDINPKLESTITKYITIINI